MYIDVMDTIRNDYKEGMTLQEWKLTEEGQYYYGKNKDSLSKRHHSKYHHKLRSLIEKIDKPTIQGYSLKQLSEHLDKIGYDTSVNQLDHKIPISWFEYGTPPHIVNHLHNIHCLTPTENKAKKDHFAHPVEEAYYHEVFPFIKNMYKQRIYYVLQKE
tara:strand:+ start:109 stop:582 length:474 start_codon:yes stop_codon:yes gene_type:complete